MIALIIKKSVTTEKYISVEKAFICKLHENNFPEGSQLQYRGKTNEGKSGRVLLRALQHTC